MSIGGYVRTSLVDYPGKIATTVFVTKCNFYCPFCQNPELVLDSVPNRIDFEEIISFIKEARHMLDAVCFSGGEPTLDPLLPDYIKQVKELGLLVKLDTNGARPEQLTSLQADYIAMDIKTSPENYPQVSKVTDITNKVLRSINLIQNELKINYEFRTTIVPGFIDKEDIHTIGKLIRGADKWLFQQFRNTSTLDPAFTAVTPYTKEKLNELVDIAKIYVPNASLR